MLELLLPNKPTISTRPSNIPTYGETTSGGETYEYLIPIQGHTNNVNIPGCTVTYSRVYSTTYSVGRMLNRTRGGNWDGLISSGNGNHVTFTFNYDFFMDAYFIQGLRSDNFRPGSHAVDVMFVGTDTWTRIRSSGAISTGSYLFKLTEEQANRPIHRVRLICTSTSLSYSRFDLLIQQ